MGQPRIQKGTDLLGLGLWAGCLTLGLAALVGALLLQHYCVSLEDDSFMFYRYAYRLASEHRLSWNPGGEPTYGLTALGYLGMVTLVFLFHHADPASVVYVASFLSGILFLALLLLAVHRGCRLGPSTGMACALLLAVAAVTSAPALAHHFSSGMDATFTMAYLASFILVAAEFERRPSRGRAVFLGAWGALAFTIRPDLLIFSFMVPACLVLFARARCPLALSGLVLVVMVAGVGLQMGLAAAFMHSPLPLPFYVKALGKHYDPRIYKVYARTPRWELYEFCRYHLPLIAVGMASFLAMPRVWWHRSGAVDKALAGGGLVFVAYYGLFVLQIVAAYGRFYFPVVPALAYLSCRSLALTLSTVFPAAGGFSGSRTLRRFVLAACLVGMVPSVWAIWADYRVAKDHDQTGHIASLEFMNRLLPSIWIGLEDISALPDDLVMAMTEVGLPGAMNPRKAIVDLAGLQTREFSHARFSADVLFDRFRPDLIYMPHPDYAMTRQIESHPAFRSRYELFDARAKHYLLDVGLLKDGKHYATLRRILSQAPTLPPEFSQRAIGDVPELLDSRRSPP